uniref:non-specific serine/threonine protein kinase n=1 Tax=Kalanchoe fedtschenkoi TaxID=63787 RepID=A0A7N0TYP5_KALFE
MPAEENNSIPLIPRFAVVTILLLFFLFRCSSACRDDDRSSLLQLQADFGAKLNWSGGGGSDCCKWSGVACDASGGIVSLDLSRLGLRGAMSRAVGSLTSLKYLNLSVNLLTGELDGLIFASLASLDVLDLSFNGFEGELPPSIFAAAGIRSVNLSSNRLSGEVNASIFRAGMSLVSLDLGYNSFSGVLPSGVCVEYMELIETLDFSNNNFSGEIGRGFGECLKLEVLRLGNNLLTGLIPVDLYSAASLMELSMPGNSLIGGISDEIVRLGSLRILELSLNGLNGSLPEGIGKLLNLEQLLIDDNQFSGSLPASLMECVKLSKLNLRNNRFAGDMSGMDFSKLVSLSTMDLGDNNFTGEIPVSIYSCKTLTAIRLANNSLRGEIASGIMQLRSLSFFSVSLNNLSNIGGAISSLLGCKNLSTLIISKNFMNEALPDGDSVDLGSNGFQSLQVLGLGACQLTGSFPSWIAKLSKLRVLDLSVNQIEGVIPGFVGSLPSLFYLDLSLNRMSGEFPIELTLLPTLTSEIQGGNTSKSYLELPMFVLPNKGTNQQFYNQLVSLPPAIYLSNNSFNGTIPVEIGRLRNLHVLDLSRNNFSGSIPQELSNLTDLERLDLSSNNLSGQIPQSLNSLTFLSFFNVSDNDLEGQIPSGVQLDTFPSTSFQGNPKLCGKILNRTCQSNKPGSVGSGRRRSLNKRLFLGFMLGIFSIGFILTSLALWLIWRRKFLPKMEVGSVNLDTVSCNSYETASDTSLVMLFRSNANDVKDLTIADILKATDNFNQANIVGCGGFGLVYKATLSDGKKLAVKKLSGEMGLMEREFKAEVEVLSTARHKNLVALQGYCIHNGVRLLMYSYMENGSLDYWLHEKTDGPSRLDWPTRLKILQGASLGLAYMHHTCVPQIVHRDIKCSNILLDEKFEAYLADFGLSRLILPHHTHVTTELVGTLGYIPPEYGQAWIATLRGDVYSFGVVMLELLTGRRPFEVSLPRSSRELVPWVNQMISEGNQHKLFDTHMHDKGHEEQLLTVLEAACLCVNQNQFKRPTIKEVVDCLRNVHSRRKFE